MLCTSKYPFLDPFFVKKEMDFLCQRRVQEKGVGWGRCSVASSDTPTDRTKLHARSLEGGVTHTASVV